MILDEKADLAIDLFVSAKMKNRNGVIYDRVCPDQQDYTADLLKQYWRAYKTLFKDENTAYEIFTERLNQIVGIRFDLRDSGYKKNIVGKYVKSKKTGIPPFTMAFDDMYEHCDQKFEGGLTFTSDVGGVVLLDQDKMLADNKKMTQEEAVHTFIHEFTHCLTAVSGFKGKKDECVIDFAYKVKDNGYLNEGFTETIAQIIWSKMYPNTACPGLGVVEGKSRQDAGRYGERVWTVKQLLSSWAKDENEKADILEEYLTNADFVVERMKNAHSQQGQDFYEYWMQNNRDYERLTGPIRGNYKELMSGKLSAEQIADMKSHINDRKTKAKNELNNFCYIQEQIREVK